MKDAWIKVGAPVHNLSLEMFRESVMKRQKEFKERTELLVKALEVDETLGQLLVSENFQNIEDT